MAAALSRGAYDEQLAYCVIVCLIVAAGILSSFRDLYVLSYNHEVVP